MVHIARWSSERRGSSSIKAHHQSEEQAGVKRLTHNTEKSSSSIKAHDQSESRCVLQRIGTPAQAQTHRQTHKRGVERERRIGGEMRGREKEREKEKREREERRRKEGRGPEGWW